MMAWSDIHTIASNGNFTGDNHIYIIYNYIYIIEIGSAPAIFLSISFHIVSTRSTNGSS